MSNTGFYSRHRRAVLCMVSLLTALTGVLLHAKTVAADNLVGNFWVWGNETGYDTNGTLAAQTIGLQPPNDPSQAMTQTVNSTIAAALPGSGTNCTNGTSGSNGCFKIFTQPTQDAKAYALPAGTFVVNTINIGYANHTTWSNPNGDCTYVGPAPTPITKVGDLTIGSGSNAGKIIAAHDASGNALTVTNGIAGQYAIPASYVANLRPGTQEAGVCISDGTNGAEAPLTIGGAPPNCAPCMSIWDGGSSAGSEWDVSAYGGFAGSSYKLMFADSAALAQYPNCGGPASTEIDYEGPTPPAGPGGIPPPGEDTSGALPDTAAQGNGEICLVDPNTGQQATQTLTVTGPPAPCDPNKYPSQAGGAYNQIPTDGCERHHMPAQRSWQLAGKTNTSCLPAIRMPFADHKQTASWGNSQAAQDYKKAQMVEILKGNVRGAFDMDVQDIKSLFPGKYDVAIQQALDYLNSRNGNYNC